jgi:hypothetical protein
MSAKLSPMFNSQVMDANGNPAVGWRINTYLAGSVDTPAATYVDADGATPHSNPIVLDALGFPSAGQIWLASGRAYKLVLTDAAGVVKETADNITGVNEAEISVSQWQASGVTPTYVSASSFTLPGDQTSEFHRGRRLQFSVTAGSVYGKITSATYGSSVTTVGVQMNSGQALDSGLSVVNLSILRADNSAVPDLTASASRVSGLAGSVNPATPLTKFDLSANSVTLRDANGATVTNYNTSTLTCDLGLAGPVANGRDQSAAFPANSWVYLYFIGNGSNVATLASLAAPATGPTLPGGYTHWAYATTIRWNGSSNIIPCVARGDVVEYDTLISLLAGGQATALTTVSASSAVPPNALRARLRTGLVISGHSGTAQFDMYLRRTGATGTGVQKQSAISSGGVPVISGYDVCELALGTSQQIDYRINTVPSGGGGGYLDALGYTVPNGDA